MVTMSHDAATILKHLEKAVNEVTELLEKEKKKQEEDPSKTAAGRNTLRFYPPKEQLYYSQFYAPVDYLKARLYGGKDITFGLKSDLLPIFTALAENKPLTTDQYEKLLCLIETEINSPNSASHEPITNFWKNHAVEITKRMSKTISLSDKLLSILPSEVQDRLKATKQDAPPESSVTYFRR